MKPAQLYVWSPALNAPSIDPKCIVVESYLRLMKKDYTVVYANDPSCSPTGELPLYNDGTTWVAGTERILAHLVKHGLNANEELTATQRADCLAYSALVQDKLYDCMLFTWYADTTNFVKNIRPAYAKILSFPSTYLVPMRLKSDAKARLAKYNVEIKDDDKGLPQNEVEEMKELQRTGWHYMYRLARETYGILDSQLGNKPYMFGEKPTTLDCIVFGHLALHLYPDLAHGRLQHILRHEYPRLATYCDRLKAEWFSTEHQESEPSEEVPSLWRTFYSNPTAFFRNIKDDIISYMGNEKPVKKSEAELDFQKKRIWSIAGGLTFFLAYVIYNGIVSVEFGDEFDDEDLEEYGEEYAAEYDDEDDLDEE